MAEFAIATGIIQVAGAGISLTKALYDFGATASSAGEHTDFIAKNISLYCRVLKTLGQQLKVENPDHTQEALDVAEELQEQSHSLFDKIWALLPQPGQDGLSLRQKIMWNFKKSRVDYLVGQLECLKTTVSLLLHVLATVPKLRKYRQSKNALQEVQEDVGLDLLEGQTLIYERYRAQQVMPDLEADARRENMAAIGLDPDSTRKSTFPSLALSRSSEQTLAQIDAYATGLSGDDSRAIVMQKTTSWLAQLYEHWTTLSDDDVRNQSAPLDKTAVADVLTSPHGPEDTEDQTRKELGRPYHSSTEKDDKQPERSRSTRHPTEVKQDPKPKGILKPPRVEPFLDEPNPAREGVASPKDLGKDSVPMDSRWTKISRTLVNPEALKMCDERFEERDDYVVVLRIVAKDEIKRLAEMTREIREARENDFRAAESSSPGRVQPEASPSPYEEASDKTPDVIRLKFDTKRHELAFKPFAISDGSVLACDLYRLAAEWLETSPDRLALRYKGVLLKNDPLPVRGLGLKMNSRVECSMVNISQIIAALLAQTNASIKKNREPEERIYSRSRSRRAPSTFGPVSFDYGNKNRNKQPSGSRTSSYPQSHVFPAPPADFYPEVEFPPPPPIDPNRSRTSSEPQYVVFPPPPEDIYSDHTRFPPPSPTDPNRSRTSSEPQYVVFPSPPDDIYSDHTRFPPPPPTDPNRSQTSPEPQYDVYHPPPEGFYSYPTRFPPPPAYKPNSSQTGSYSASNQPLR